MPTLIGARVTAVARYRDDVIHQATRGDGGTSGDQSRIGLDRRLLRNDRIVSLHRYGKELAIEGSSGRIVAIHLGMSGQLLCPIGKREKPHRTDHIHLVWSLITADGRRGKLIFRDPRRFGGIRPFASFDDLNDQRWGRLGPDALTIQTRQLRSRLATTTRAIKAVLLDQTVLAGVGNIYADESLFSARVNPHRSARDISRDECRRLSAAIRLILRRAIAAGGTTIRDYVDGSARSGQFRASLRAYGHAGEPCRNCGVTMLKTVIAGRSTCFCPSCQNNFT